jgi:hypothetical protein
LDAAGFDAPSGFGDGFARTVTSSNAKAHAMTTFSKASTRTPARKPAGPRLSERLPGMSDSKLLTYQTAVGRMIADPDHPKHAAGRRAFPMIETEILRRANKL